MNTKKQMVDHRDSELTITSQCEFLAIKRSTFYYEPVPDFTPDERKILNRMDEIYTEIPFYGHRKVCWQLQEEGHDIGRDKTLRYMHILGLETFYPRKKVYTSIADKDHRKYPYLLKGLSIEKPNQVWAIDITYIRMKTGFCYLVAIIDWFSRAILSHRISNSLEVQFCLEALKIALELYGLPDIFNSDQGSQFTSKDFTDELLNRKIQISMDSVGRAIDNIVIERFFRSLKYEEVYLKEYETIGAVKQGVQVYMEFYNHKRIHQSLGYKVPFQVYLGKN